MSMFYLSHTGSDREHSSIIASNFPSETTDGQIRHFFKDVTKTSAVLSDTLVRYCKII